MPATFGPEERLELITRHAEREVACDWDGALATMTDQPYYEHYPLGVRVRGREAIKAFWQRLLTDPEFKEAALTAKTKVWDLGDSTVSVYEWDPADGQDLPTRAWAVFRFVDGLIESETIYADPGTGVQLERVFDAEFMRHPGVERI